MESVRVLSRSSASSSSSSPSSGTVPPSASSSIPLSSASVPYTPPAPPLSSFNHPPRYPPLPSPSHLNPGSSGRGFPSSSSIHPGAKITILTSSASSLISSSVTGSPSSSSVPPPEDGHTPFPATSEQGNLSTDAPPPPPVEYPINGVVAVGVIGRSEADLSQLLDRLIDSQVFWSQSSKSHSDFKLPVISPEAQTKEDNTNALNTPINTLTIDEQKQQHVLQSERGKNPTLFDTESEILQNPKAMKRLDWMQRRVKYYYDEEKGTVYVQFAWEFLPSEMICKGVGIDGLPGTIEECEKNTLRGLLFMFSVCHVVILLQENGRVDTHLLRTLRILQNAKHLLAPFVKTHVLPGIHPAVPSLERSSLMKSSSGSTGQSPGRGGGSVRSTSTIALMSGSAPSFFPGQCTPVLLFVFLEDFSDATTSHHERPEPTSTQVVSHGGPILASRQTVQLKGSNPVVMLARATSKAEGGLRKKLQSSLEAQIRYLVKKCKILAGSVDNLAAGGSGIGPRGPGSNMGASSGVLGGSSLFVLDSMRVVCLLNKSPNLPGDSLEAAMGIMNDMLSGKDVPDNALAGLTGNVSEDIQAIKDFIWKQGEILRGRGGNLSNSTAGSMGVGMVAVAAAAAAASAAAGGFGGSTGPFKPLGNPPELPSMSNWLSACHTLMVGLTAGEGSLMKAAKKIIPIRVPSGSRRGASDTNTSVHGKDALEVTLGSLESGTELDMNFSADWCKRMFPSALSVYTKALPPCYTTVVHQSHLQKALHMFQAKVRGPAVPSYMKKLTEECEIIWKSGRQLCDAISLTGRPCIHRVHDVLQDKEKEGEKLDQSNMDHAICHSSGLVFLHACACGRSRKLREDPFDYKNANTTFFHFPNCEELLPKLIIPDCEGNKPMGGSAWSLVRLGGAKYYQKSTGLLQSGFSHNKKYLLPWIISYLSGYLMQGTTVFPIQVPEASQQEDSSNNSHPLFRNFSFVGGLEHDKGGAGRGIDMQMHKQSKEVEITVSVEEKHRFASSLTGDDKRLFSDVARSNIEVELAFPTLQQRQFQHRIIAKQVGVLDKKEAAKQLGQSEPQSALSTAPSNFEEKQNVAASLSVYNLGHSTRTNETAEEAGLVGVKHAVLHLGFEHECPHGHRFLLSHEQVEALGSIGINLEQQKNNDMESSKNGQKMFHNGETAMSVSTNTMIVGQKSSFKLSANVMGTNLELPDGIPCKIVNAGSGEGYALLNTNLPLYMMCPYCSKSSEKRKNSPAFAGNISQLQRIFLVTPPLPLLVAACPVVQFSDESISQATKQEAKAGSNTFSLGCDVVLPPESLVVLRLPFVYFVELQDGSRYPLKYNVSQPENTGWLCKGTAFKVISDRLGV